MKPEEIERIKKAITYLEIARRSGYVTFHAMLDGETFNKEVIEPLEKLSQWNEEDKKSVIELTERFKKETKSKTLKEKSDKLKKILKIGLISVITGGVGLAAHKMFKKNGANK